VSRFESEKTLCHLRFRRVYRGCARKGFRDGLRQLGRIILAARSHETVPLDQVF